MADYEVNYDDPRLTEVREEESAALTENETTYGNMIASSDDFYNKQIEASKDWAEKQTELQNQQTEFAIEQIEQQRDKTEKDYLREQSAAYVDWQKQSDSYGVNSEKMAANGMTNTGYSESSKVAMYTAYQNRVATAREVFAQANLNYDNSIKEARLQNSAALAEIAYNAYTTQLELALQGLQYKNELLDKKIKENEELREVQNEILKQQLKKLEEIE